VRLDGSEDRERIYAIADSLPDPDVPAPARFQVLAMADLLMQPRPKWLIRDVMPDRGVVVTYGPSGSGKTFIEIEKACAIVRGVAFFGRRTRQGPVIYIASEGSLRLRMEAYMQGRGVAAAELDGLGVIESTINLLEHTGAELADLCLAIRAYLVAIGETRPVLIIVDTLNRAMPGGNENSSEDMGRAIEAATTLGVTFECAVEFVHHSGKDETKGSRGHSSLKCATEAELTISREGNIRTLIAEKVRDGADGVTLGHFSLEPIDLGAVSDDDPEAEEDERYWSCVVRPVEASEVPAPKEKYTPLQSRMINAIHRCFDRHAMPAPGSLRDVANPPIEGQTVILLEDLADDLKQHGNLTTADDPDTERRGRLRVLKRLQDIEIVRFTDKHLWLVP